MSDPDFDSTNSNDVAAGTLERILGDHSYQQQRKANTMAAPYRVQPRALASGGGNGNRTTGLANGEPGGISQQLRDAINHLFLSVGAEPLDADLSEEIIINMIENLANSLESASSSAAADNPGGTAAMSNRSPGQRFAALNNRQPDGRKSRMTIAKELAAKDPHGRSWEELIKFVPE